MSLALVILVVFMLVVMLRLVMFLQGRRVDGLGDRNGGATGEGVDEQRVAGHDEGNEAAPRSAREGGLR